MDLAVSGVLSLAAAFCLPRMLNLKGNTLAISNSWFSVLAYGGVWFLCCRSLRDVRQACGGKGKSDMPGKWGCHGMGAACAIAGLFSLCIAFGVQLDCSENVNFRDGGMWLAVLAWTAVLAVWIFRGWMWLEQRGCRGGCGREPEEETAAEKQRGRRDGCGREPEEETAVAEQRGCRDDRKTAVCRGSADSAGEAGDTAGRPGRGRAVLWRGWTDAWLGRWDGMAGRKRAVIRIAFFLLCWLPVFLAVYPGFFVYDAQDELMQVQTRRFTTHHPLPHVLLLGGIIQAVHKLTGSYNAGIASYTLLQMAGMAGVFSYVLYFMEKSGVRRWLRIATALYFAFFPVNVMFVLCSAKDGIFSAALLLVLVSLTDLGMRPEGFRDDWDKWLLFGGGALVMMCFRHNGMYAFLVLVPAVLLFCGKRCGRKMVCRMVLLLGIVFGAYTAVTAGLAGLLSAGGSEKQEMLTVPIQQLARVWNYEGDSLTEEQKETLYEILPEEALAFYTAKVSDGVKRWFVNEAFASDPWKYARLWAEVGMRHPFSYLNAWFMTSYGFWYPDTVIDVYRGNGVFTFTYGDSSFFGYEVELPGERESRIPWLDEWYRRLSLEITQQKVPAVSMLFSPGFLFWIFVFTGGYAYYRRQYGLLLPFGMVLLLWLTVVLGPTYLPRYVLILWFALPGAAAVLVKGD